MAPPSPRERLPLLILSIYAVCLILIAGPVPSPVEVRAVAGVAALMLLPGAGLALLWPRLENRGWPAVLALSFPLSLVEILGIVLLERVTGWPPATLTAAALFVGFVGILASLLFAWHREPPVSRPGAKALALLLPAAGGLLLFGGAPMSPTSDGPDHVAAVREILVSRTLFPAQGLVADGELDRADPRKGILHVGLALAASAGRVSASDVWRAFPGVIALSWLCLVYLLGLRLSGGEKGALIAVVLALVFLGGDGGRWASRLGYGAHAGLVVTWAALWGLLELIDEFDVARLVLLGALAGVAGAVHALAPVFFFLIAGGLWLTGLRGPAAQRARLTGAVAVAVALSAPVLLMRLLQVQGSEVNPLHRQVMPVLELGDRVSVLWPPETWRMLGPVGVLGVALVVGLRRFGPGGWGTRFLVVSTVAPLALVGIPGVFDLATRLGSSLPIKTLFMVPWFWILGAFLGRGWRGRSIPPRVGVLLVLFAALPRAGSGFSPERVRGSRPEGADALLAALNEIDGRVVVTADPWISSLIAAETDHFPVTVFHQHGHPLDPRGLERLDDLGRALSPWTDAATTREVMRRYRSAYIAVPDGGSAPLEVDFATARGGDLDQGRARKLQAFPAGFSRVSRAGGWTLYRQRPGEAPAPPPPFLAEQGTPDGSPVPPSDGVGPGARLLSVVAPDRWRAGEEHSLVCWWQRSTGSPSPDAAWPLELHLRLVREGGREGFRPARLLKERLGGQARHRFRHTVAPFEGGWPASSWPVQAVADTVVLRLPAEMEPGRYELCARVLPRPLFTRISLGDLLQEEDRFQGESLKIVEIEVSEE